MQEKNEKNVIVENNVEINFIEKNFNCDVENYLNICNDTQADLFNKIKTLFLINYWTLSMK